MSAHHMGRLASRPQEAVRGLISLTARPITCVQHRHGAAIGQPSSASLRLPQRGSTMKLTAASLANLNLESGDKDRIWFDDDVPGFGLRVRDTGSRSWIYQYKIGGKTRRLVLGQATAIKPARALPA